MRTSRRALLGALVAVVLLGMSSPLIAGVLRPSPLLLKGSPSPFAWSGPQFVQADAQGHVYLLRADTLDVYSILSKSHELGEPARIVLPNELPPDSVKDAAMSREGAWLIGTGPETYLWERDRATQLPRFSWRYNSLSFLGGDAVLAVGPPQIGPIDRSEWERPLPLLLRASRDGWSVELREAALNDNPPSNIQAELAARALFVRDLQGGRYLLARANVYRIALYVRGKKAPNEELRIGSAEPKLEGAAAAEKRLAATLGPGVHELNGQKAHAFRNATRAILAVEKGPGGILYALVGESVTGSEHCVLDRIDWDRHTVERAELLNFACPGRVSMAVGRDGLYFANYSGEEPRYFVSWDQMSTASWSVVKDAEFVQ